MAELTDVEVIAVQDEIALPQYTGKTQAEVVSLLMDTPEIDNPTPAPQVPRPFVLSELTELLSVPNRNKFFARDDASQFPLVDRILAQDRKGLATWLDVLATRGDISRAEEASLNARANETISDQNHPPRMAGPNRLTLLLGRTVGSLNGDDVTRIFGA